MFWPFKKRENWKKYFDQGMSYGSSGDLDNALNQFRKAAEIAPLEPFPHYELGYTLVLLGRYPEALEELNDANSLSPGFFLVQTEIYLCKTLISRELDSEVLSLLRQLQQLTDTSRGGSPQAIALSRTVVERAPDCALAHYYLGKALFQQDRDRSEAAMRRCLELSPDDTTAISALTDIGLHREAAEDMESARKFWSIAITKYAGNPHTKMTELILGQRSSA